MSSFALDNYLPGINQNLNNLIDFSLVSEFEEVYLLAGSFYAYKFTDNVGQAGTTLKIRYTTVGADTISDFSAETDANLDIDFI